MSSMYTTISQTLTKIPKSKYIECLKFCVPLVPILLSLLAVQFLEIFKKNTIEMIILNGLVFSYLTAEQIIITTSKVINNYLYFFRAHILFITLFPSVI